MAMFGSTPNFDELLLFLFPDSLLLMQIKRNSSGFCFSSRFFIS